MKLLNAIFFSTKFRNVILKIFVLAIVFSIYAIVTPMQWAGSLQDELIMYLLSAILFTSIASWIYSLVKK